MTDTVEDQIARAYYNHKADPQHWPTWEAADRQTKQAYRDDVRFILHEVAWREAEQKRIAAFMKKLNKNLAKRAAEDGHAWVDTHEASFLVKHDLYQPGHTMFRYSVPDEDLSDATQLAPREEEDEGLEDAA